MLFKKEFPPTDDEIEAYKRGEAWDKKKAEEIQRKKVNLQGSFQQSFTIGSIAHSHPVAVSKFWNAI